MSTGLLVSAGQSLRQKINIPVMAAFWVFVWSGGDRWGLSFPLGVLRARMQWSLKFWHVAFFSLLQSSNIRAAAAGAQLWRAGCICEMNWEQVPRWWLLLVKQWDGGTEGEITPPTPECFNDTAGISPIRASHNHQSDAQGRVPRKAWSVYSRFLFSSSWHVTYQRLPRSKEALMATFYSATVKRGKWEKRKRDKANRKSAPNEEQPFTRLVTVQKATLTLMRIPLMLLKAALRL